MYDAATGRGLAAAAGVGRYNRIIAARRFGSVEVAAGTIDGAVANAGAIGAANTISTDATDAAACTGAQAGFAIRAP